MVSFLTLFLGLVVGYQTVAVQVAEPVAWVEVRLDGEPVARLEAPKWRGQIDLGPQLLPHELTAVAFDRSGTELDRASQWLNLPRPPAETTILLEHDKASGRRTANVTWKSLTGDEPSAVRVEFDGRELEFDDPRAVPLPAYDPAALHFLRVELEFAGFVSSSAEITFGGTYADQINTELTALPVVPVGRKKVPSPDQLADGFFARQRLLSVAAVEKGPVELLVVRDRGAWPRLREIRRQALSAPRRTVTDRQVLLTMEPSDWFAPARSGWELWTFQFLWPVPRRMDTGTGPYDLFSHSAKLAGTSGSLHGWLTTLEQPTEWSGPQRLADAVAVAAVTVAGSNRRRAVLLLLGPPTDDASEASPETVRRYLESLAVPLLVWSTDPDATAESAWGPVVDVSDYRLMSRATRRLFRTLDKQRIVWLEGLHLPQQITLSRSLAGKIAAAR